jgi:Rne/Rng family ribonuclease
MAIGPKGGRKRVSKRGEKKDKNVEQSVEETTSVESESTDKKNSSIPSPIFQAAPTTVAPARSKKSEASEDSDSDDEKNNRRKRRRGGRGKKHGRDNGEENSDSNEKSEDSDSSETNDNSEETGTHRRRRRRRAKGSGDATPGEVIEEDGVKTVVKVREPKQREERSNRHDRHERHDRRDRRDRGYRREGREFVRRRGTVITEGEYLARRDNVNRVMLVRQTGDRTQIAVLEDKVMVEHYVNRNSNISYVGNVYLGKVQNVLPSMEAAFVDIGKGRNAVLYAGEVNWDAAGLTDGTPRKIEHVLKTGQPVLVQVTKDPIGQKGARLTSQVSLPGRYLVYVPSGEMSGISRRLPEEERTRLKNILKDFVPEDAGVIVRTASEGASQEELEHDVSRLRAQWEDIKAKSEDSSTHAPSLLYAEPDLTIRVIRDIFNEDFEKLIVQGDEASDEINNYLGFIAPELTGKIEKWTGTKDLFTEYRIEEQLAKAFDRKVYLPSGGSLVIDRTEAMVVIDVNTGKFIGKGGNLEETVTKNNLEAAEEIARQLRLRDLGGIVVIDFIDMTLESNRDLVMRRLIECLGRDRTKHQVAEVTSLGLVQMTRKRVGQGLIEAFSTTCESCGGRGIHIHNEPVRKVALEKDLEQRYVPNVEDDEDHDEESHHDSDENDIQTNNSDQSEQSENDDSAEKSDGGKRGKRRRRAVSSGVITPV